MDLLADLTPAQQDAVTHLEGPLLIVAAAGSGKTRVITRRVAYLLQQGVRPWNILAITFTNKAAGEMRDRVHAIIPSSRVWISTFHSLGARLMRQHADRFGLDRNFTIYDQDDRKRMIKTVLEEARIDNVHFTPDRIQSAISRAKNQLQGPENYGSQANDFFEETVAKVYPLYEKRMREANALDFDDLLYWVARMLRNDPELRRDLDERFQYVLIDEYQDTNYAQYAIARGLSADFPNLCVVGDPDQSIYRWRGSDIRNILDFERDFPSARVITLEKNYRSTKSILRAADQLIGHNVKRKPKALLTDNPVGAPVTVLRFGDSGGEANGVAERIRQAVTGGGRRYRDFAIFLRVNALSRALETALIRQQVPYQMVRGLAFFERKENKDMLAYLRLLLNPRDDLSFVRVVNEPPRGVGKVSLEHLRAYAAPRQLSLLAAAAEVQRIPEIKGKAAKGLADVARIIRELSAIAETPADEVIRQVMEKTGYRKMLMESTDPEDQERLANIEELITAARQFATEDGLNDLPSFLEYSVLVSDVDAWAEDQDQVSIMTLHAAKGLEFPVVYIVAVEQGLLPHERSSLDQDELEEERRLAFVGMTRAKEELYLCHAGVREFRGSAVYAIPSLFLEELPKEGIERIDLAGPVSRPSFTAYNQRSWQGPSFRTSGGARDSSRRAGAAPAQTRAAKKAPAESVPGTNFNGLEKGDLVRHQVYGLGKVVDLTGSGPMRKVKIRFATQGEKTFVLEMAPLERVGKM